MVYEFECSRRLLRFFISVSFILALDIPAGFLMEGIDNDFLFWILDVVKLLIICKVISYVIKPISFIRTKCKVEIVNKDVHITTGNKKIQFNLDQIEEISFLEAKIYDSVWATNWDKLYIKTTQGAYAWLAKPNEIKNDLSNNTLYCAMTLIQEQWHSEGMQ